MREILFRGKRFDNGEWIEGNYRAVRNSRFLYIERIDKPTDCYRVDLETVGQYTGLTDKNGKKIFEGDIINLEGLGNAVVRFGKYNDCNSDFKDDYAVGFYLEDRNVKCNILTDVEIMSGCEIIGNIHDN